MTEQTKESVVIDDESEQELSEGEGEKRLDSVPSPKSPQPQCSYRDFSRVLPDAPAASKTTIPSNAKEPTFPSKLHAILSNPDFQDVISWLPHGRSWRILQQKAFEERVIPFYFRHGRYSSFARQVNGWGFRRVTHGSDYNSYYHEVSYFALFVRKDQNTEHHLDDDVWESHVFPLPSKPSA